MSDKIDIPKFMARLAELFVVSKTAAEYCRSIVMEPLVGNHAVGSQLFVVNQDGTLSQLSSFGKTIVPSTSVLSIWDENLVSKAVRDNVEAKGEMVHPESGETFHIFVYPCRRPTNPVGAVVMVKTADWAVVLEDEDQRTLSLMGALWLETLGISEASTNGNGSSSPDDLTPRQKTILKQIAEGKTNAEIAKDLILSESSIRQETVRIYKALGVGSRQEASKRAIHLGIIERMAV